MCLVSPTKLLFVASLFKFTTKMRSFIYLKSKSPDSTQRPVMQSTMASLKISNSFLIIIGHYSKWPTGYHGKSRDNENQNSFLRCRLSQPYLIQPLHICHEDTSRWVTWFEFRVLPLLLANSYFWHILKLWIMAVYGGSFKGDYLPHNLPDIVPIP